METYVADEYGFFEGCSQKSKAVYISFQRENPC